MKYYASIISLSLSHFFHLFFLDVIVGTLISPASVFSKSPPSSTTTIVARNLDLCQSPPSLSIPPVYLIYPGTIPQPPLSTSSPWPSLSILSTVYNIYSALATNISFWILSPHYHFIPTYSIIFIFKWSKTWCSFFSWKTWNVNRLLTRLLGCTAC